MALSRIQQKNNQETTLPRRRRVKAEVHDAIQLRIVDGLLMAFGPEGDPVPPALLRMVSREGPTSFLEQDSGAAVDCERVLTVFGVQQRGALADRPGDRWIRAMLGLEGSFEPTPPELLEEEPNDPLPDLPALAALNGDGGAPKAGRLTAAEDVASDNRRTVLISFDAAEEAKMAKADALLFRGLVESMTLSAGNFDPLLEAWVLRPDELDSLRLDIEEDAPGTLAIGIDAIVIRGNGDRWSIGTKIIDLS